MRCIIETCTRDFAKSGLSSHRLPKNWRKRQEWLKVLDPSGTQFHDDSKEARICSRHFHENDFYTSGGKRKLYGSAVPSRHLGPAAKLPPAEIPEEPHCVFLDESMMVRPDMQNVPAQVTVYSPAQEPEPSGVKRVKTIRYAGDLKEEDVPFVSPEEAQEFLPKIYRQLQQTKMRLKCYRQQNLRLRKKVEHMKDIIMDLRNEYDGVPSTKRNDQQLVTKMEIGPSELSEGFVE